MKEPLIVLVLALSPCTTTLAAASTDKETFEQASRPSQQFPKVSELNEDLALQIYIDHCKACIKSNTNLNLNYIEQCEKISSPYVILQIYDEECKRLDLSKDIFFPVQKLDWTGFPELEKCWKKGATSLSKSKARLNELARLAVILGSGRKAIKKEDLSSDMFVEILKALRITGGEGRFYSYLEKIHHSDIVHSRDPIELSIKCLGVDIEEFIGYDQVISPIFIFTAMRTIVESIFKPLGYSVKVEHVKGTGYTFPLKLSYDLEYQFQ